MKTIEQNKFEGNRVCFYFNKGICKFSDDMCKYEHRQMPNCKFDSLCRRKYCKFYHGSQNKQGSFLGSNTRQGTHKTSRPNQQKPGFVQGNQQMQNQAYPGNQQVPNQENQPLNYHPDFNPNQQNKGNQQKPTYAQVLLNHLYNTNQINPINQYPSQYQFYHPNYQNLEFPPWPLN